MRSSQKYLNGWLLSALVFTGSLIDARAEMRTWTSATGASLEAEFAEQRIDTVVLRNAEGELLEIRLNQLSREDQVYVGSLRAPATAARRAGGGTAGDQEAPSAIRDAFGEHLVNARGQRVSAADLQGKKIGLYFSAQWCPPCRAFTPQLVSAYEQLKKENKPFEIIFVSHDRSESDMYKYMREYKMPWLAIRFDEEKREQLKTKHGVRGIPALVIVDDSGETLSATGRSDVASQGSAAFDGW